MQTLDGRAPINLAPASGEGEGPLAQRGNIRGRSVQQTSLVGEEGPLFRSTSFEKEGATQRKRSTTSCGFRAMLTSLALEARKLFPRRATPATTTEAAAESAAAYVSITSLTDFITVQTDTIIRRGERFQRELPQLGTLSILDAVQFFRGMTTVIQGLAQISKSLDGCNIGSLQERQMMVNERLKPYIALALKLLEAPLAEGNNGLVGTLLNLATLPGQEHVSALNQINLADAQLAVKLNSLAEAAKVLAQRVADAAKRGETQNDEITQDIAQLHQEFPDFFGLADSRTSPVELPVVTVHDSADKRMKGERPPLPPKPEGLQQRAASRPSAGEKVT